MTYLKNELEQACELIAKEMGWLYITVGWRGSSAHNSVEFYTTHGATQWKRSVPLFSIKEPVTSAKVLDAVKVYQVTRKLQS